jgi:hypothetical protein
VSVNDDGGITADLTLEDREILLEALWFDRQKHVESFAAIFSETNENMRKLGLDPAEVKRAVGIAQEVAARDHDEVAVKLGGDPTAEFWYGVWDEVHS